MKTKTRLMSKLGNRKTPSSFVKRFSEAVDEALENGNSEVLDDEGVTLNLAEQDGEVIVEDTSTEELTKLTTNPEDPSDMSMEPIEDEDSSDDDDDEDDDVVEFSKKKKSKSFSALQIKLASKNKKQTPKLRRFSETLPDVEIPFFEGLDGKHTEDTLKDSSVEISDGVKNPEKAGVVTYSVKMKGFNVTQAKAVSKLFSDVEPEIKETEEGIEFEVDSTKELTPIVDEIKDEVKETSTPTEDTTTIESLMSEVEGIKSKAEELEESGDAALAAEVKTMSEELIKKCTEMAEIDTESVETMCKKFAETATEVLDNSISEEPTEDETSDEVDEESENIFNSLLAPDDTELNTELSDENTDLEIGKNFSRRTKFNPSDDFEKTLNCNWQ